MSAETHYVAGEGRPFMAECITVAMKWCVNNAVEKMVIFTATGDGPLYAITNLIQEYPSVSLIAVTPPVGRIYKNPEDPESYVRAGIGSDTKSVLSDFGVPVIAAHLPFKEIHNGKERSSEWTRVGEALGILGGGFALCVQSLLVACDAGEVGVGERVVVTTADTAVAALASRTELFLSPTDGLLIEHIICRPMRYSVSKVRHHFAADMWPGRQPHIFEGSGNQLSLPEPGSQPPGASVSEVDPDEE